MPRKLIIGILIVLILGIVGGTVALVVQRLRPDTPLVPTSSDPAADLPSAQTGNQQVVDPSGDTDGDGLSNADEVLWGTDPANPDTDGDGFRDGEEVIANHNPTIPSPNDALPENFRPGQNLQPLATAPLQADQYFDDSVDLTPSGGNHTDSYRQRFPTEQQSQDTLAAFVYEQPIITSLPAIQSGAFETSDTASLQAYLAVAANVSSLSDSALLAKGLSDLYTQSNPATIRSLQLQVQNYQASLLNLASVPTQAVEVHKLLLGYTELVIATFDQIAQWQTDPVRSMVGVRQLQENDGKYYSLLQQELARLEAL